MCVNYSCTRAFGEECKTLCHTLYPAAAICDVTDDKISVILGPRVKIMWNKVPSLTRYCHIV